MLDKHLKPVARAMLQARLDGKMARPEQGAAIMGKYAPKGGYTVADMKALGTFSQDLREATVASSAKLVADKYNLDIVY